MPTRSSPQPSEIGYPTYPLAEALRISEAIRELGGSKVGVAKEFLAKHLKYAPTGPSFVQRLGAAKAFGLIEGRGEYALTDLAKRFFYPTSPRDSQDALIAMMKMPPAFRVVMSRFEGGSYPSAEIIGNVMHNEANIPESWKTKLANIFLRSLEVVGPLGVTATVKGKVASEERRADYSGQGEVAPFQDTTRVPPKNSYDMPLSNNRKVTVTAPEDLTAAEMRRLQAWLPLTFLVDWNPEEKA